MLRHILHQSNGHSLTTGHISSHTDHNCLACTQGKFITRPSSLKVDSDTPQFLERIQGDICGPINPTSGPFRYFMVLVDASTRWYHVFLLSTRNLAYARLLAQIIKLRAHFPDHPKFSSPSPSPYFIYITTRYQHDCPEAIGSFGHLQQFQTFAKTRSTQILFVVDLF